MEVQYFISTHEHPLRLKDVEDDDELMCQTCGLGLRSTPVNFTPFYACDLCEYRLHTSCAVLPHEIVHPFHPSDHGPLTLNDKKSTWCSSCFRDYEDSPFYDCRLCGLNMDPECALMATTAPRSSEGQRWIQHFSHPHSLLLLEKGEPFKCAACDSESRGGAYGCLKCDYFIEKSCAELPVQIHHPLHAHHGVLDLLVQGLFTCGLCSSLMQGLGCLSFSCGQCEYWTCVKCAKDVTRSTRNVKYEDHEHPLYLAKNITVSKTNTHCDGYDDYCAQSFISSSNDFKSAESYMLWCWECNFSIHLMCGPLPTVIKHDCHIHPLLLFDSLCEEDCESYCDVCETERDPWIRLYCCRDCEYYAHVNCVISEIEKTHNGELKDLKLKSPGQDIWERNEFIIDNEGQDKLTLTLKDAIKNLSEKDRGILRKYYKWDETSRKEKGIQENCERSIVTTHIPKLKDEEIDEILRLSRFTEVEFERFFSNLEQFYQNNTFDFKSRDLELKIVKVRGYMIPLSLAKVLNTLFYEFGDIGSGLSTTLEMKSFIFFIVCKVIKRMHCTMAKGITKTLLQEWYYHLRFARIHGFKIGFACAQLEQLVQTFLGIQAKRLEDEVPAALEKKNVELQHRFEKLKEYKGSSPKPEFMKTCLKKASESVWKDALGDLSKHKDESPLIAKRYWGYN